MPPLQRNTQTIQATATPISPGPADYFFGVDGGDGDAVSVITHCGGQNHGVSGGR